MYIPAAFEEPDLATLHGLIDARPLATWVVNAGGDLVVNHLPFLVDRERGDRGTLVGHVARANPIWRSAQGATSVVVFHGPQAYVTPSWYPSKHVDGKSVPTWNYVVVHARGAIRIIDDRARLRTHVQALTSHMERTQERPWQLSDAPPPYIDALLGAIVGIEIEIHSLAGKWKLSQNRASADFHGAASGLGHLPDSESHAVAHFALDWHRRNRPSE